MVWAAAQKQGFDKLVMLLPAVSDNDAEFQPGFGFHERSIFLLTPWRCAYVGYLIGVYDVAKRESIGWEWGSTGGYIPCKPKSSNDIPFRKHFSEYSTSERKLLRERLELRLAETIPYTLAELSLISEARAK